VSDEPWFALDVDDWVGRYFAYVWSCFAIIAGVIVYTLFVIAGGLFTLIGALDYWWYIVYALAIIHFAVLLITSAKLFRIVQRNGGAPEFRYLYRMADAWVKAIRQRRRTRRKGSGA
jgi:hypothetical protein